MGDKNPIISDYPSQVQTLSFNEIDMHNLLGFEDEDIEEDEGTLISSGNSEKESEDLALQLHVDGNNNGDCEPKSLDCKPFIGQEFDTIDDAYNFYNLYARNQGFGVRKSTASRSKVTKEVIWKKFVCNKEGFKEMNTKGGDGTIVKRRRETREGCSAKLGITLQKHGKWVVSMFEDNHSHVLSTPSKAHMHRSHNNFHKESCKKLINQFHSCGLQPSKIAKAINSSGRSEVVGVTPKQVMEHLRINRKNNIGREGVAIAMHFQKQKSMDPNFYFAMELDTEGTLRSMFWADSRSRSAHLNFGDVIVFDVTYKTNNCFMPFAPFTGVNHHRQSILFGCALLADETEETFVWLFQEWLNCMYGKAPGAIITDMDGAMRNAIKRVFPNTRHRFYSWHISKHLNENVQLFRDRESDFSKDYRIWYKSKNPEESEKHWKLLKEKYHIDDKSWLGKMWERRCNWVPAYFKDIFVAGMTSSGCSESINAFFDGYVNSNTSLSAFVEQYDKALASRYKAEADEDFKSMNSKAVLTTRNPLEAHAGKVYTRNIFKLFHEEFQDSIDCWHRKLSKVDNVTIYNVGLLDDEQRKWFTVVDDESDGINCKCDCAKFETEGLLCKHILHIISKKQVSCIPERYLLRRWTIDARHQVVNRVFTCYQDEEVVTPLMNWCLVAKANKLLEEASHSVVIYKKIDVLFDNGLSDITSHNSENIAQNEGCSIYGLTRLESESIGLMPEISIRDPQPIKTKGHPRIASRIPSGLEVSQAAKKKRKCGVCGEKGHYTTTCPKKVKKPLVIDEEDDACEPRNH